MNALWGRQEERDAFSSCLESAIQGSPRVLLFEGEAGSGKTSLLEEIDASPLLPRSRIRVALLRVSSDEPADIVSRAARAVTRIGLYDRIGGRRRFAAMIERLLPEWMGAIPGWGDLLEAITATARAVSRRRARKRSTASPALPEDIEAVLRAATRRPVALLLDDLHLLDDPAARRLEKLLASAEVGTRLLVIGTLRSPAPGAPRPPIRALLERLPSQRLVHRALPPLQTDDVMEWVRHRFDGAEPPASFTRELFALTGGQPGPLAALLDNALARGAISRGASGWAFDDSLLAGTTESAQSPDEDLAAVAPVVAEIVRTASVLGDEFDAIALAELIGKDELYVEDQLAAAARAGVVQDIGSTSIANDDFTTRYRFTSSALRAALYRSLPPDARRSLEVRHSPAP